MTAIDFITELFCPVDTRLNELGLNERHSQGKLYPSEVVTIAFLYALKGRGGRAFYRWLNQNYRGLFPHLPERTRLFRLFKRYSYLVAFFLAEPSLLGVIDSYGIELIHPRREGRSEQQIGKKGKSNGRWIVGGKLCLLLNHLGQIVAWACDTANVYDGSAFQQLVDAVADEMVVFSDTGFNKQDWQPTNLRLCHRGEWNVRMLIETVLSMLTGICNLKKLAHRSWEYFQARLGFTMALFNVLVEWHGLQPDPETGFVALSIAEFDIL
jgi:hypothetical protein